MRITNCHTHLFTHRHVPRFYPHPLIWPFKRAPGLVRGLAALARLLGHEGAALSLRRLHRFQCEAASGTQAEIFARLLAQYPQKHRAIAVVLTTDRTIIPYRLDRRAGWLVYGRSRQATLGCHRSTADFGRRHAIAHT